MRTKQRLALVALVAAVAGAGLAVSVKPAQASLTLLAQQIGFIGASNVKKTASFENPLPAGIYPVWSTDQAISCNSGASAVSTQLTAGGRYILQCGAFKAWADQGTSAITAEMNVDRLLLPNGQMPLRVDNATTQGYVAVICTNAMTCILSLDQ